MVLPTGRDPENVTKAVRGFERRTFPEVNKLGRRNENNNRNGMQIAKSELLTRDVLV
jgi:hypothetical protein